MISSQCLLFFSFSLEEKEEEQLCGRGELGGGTMRSGETAVGMQYERTKEKNVSYTKIFTIITFRSQQNTLITSVKFHTLIMKQLLK